MDTVWITLMKVSKVDDGKLALTPKTYMFGPTGVISFEKEGKFTILSNKDTVDCEPSEIMRIIGSIRKTIKQEKPNVKSKATKTKRK